MKSERPITGAAHERRPTERAALSSAIAEMPPLPTGAIDQETLRLWIDESIVRWRRVLPICSTLGRRIAAAHIHALQLTRMYVLGAALPE